VIGNMSKVAVMITHKYAKTRVWFSWDYQTQRNGMTKEMPSIMLKHALTEDRFLRLTIHLLRPE
jgi:hypothetical protein